MDLSDAAGRQTLIRQAAMVIPEPYQPPWLVGEVLGVGRLPDSIAEVPRAVLGCLGGRGGLANIEVVHPGPSLLIGAPHIGIGSNPCPGAALTPGGQPVRNGAPIALIVICPDRPIIFGRVSLCLTGSTSRQGPPSGGITSCVSLYSASICARRFAGGLCHSPGVGRLS